MPNKNYLRGRRLEYQVKKDLEAKGYHVTRAAGSHSKFDLIAIRYTRALGNMNYPHTEVRLIQCKSLKKDTLSARVSLVKGVIADSPIKESGGPVYLTTELAVKGLGKKDYELTVVRPTDVE